jgi:hypothetical protein
MLGQSSDDPSAGAPSCDGVVVAELSSSVVADEPSGLEDELEPSLVCACATIAPPPIIAPAIPSDNKPLRIQFCMCITSSRAGWAQLTKHGAY